ncbi:hypothetical protein F3Y22_tig00110600pilonHSYRG00013 [Hibiscus syriacus]|uniref:Uncharacterized protein n=1 Tax=Hibiscus syriacus TaxID=106335 RepID=A0A6A3A1P4_HIBSY|nr:hypothetical protein F3Y22_tig00110600pilonHSYRG00013 [Hibiscus syriacus]
MGLPNTKTWLICLALISTVVIGGDADAPNGGRFIDQAVLDRCKWPGGPHPGCHPNPNAPPRQANPYNRGCSRHNRCRH